MKSVKQILMERDNITKSEAEELIAYVKKEMDSFGVTTVILIMNSMTIF